MCNTYYLKPKKNAVTDFDGRLNEAIAALPHPLIRRTGWGMAILPDLTPLPMRWGFPSEAV